MSRLYLRLQVEGWRWRRILNTFHTLPDGAHLVCIPYNSQLHTVFNMFRVPKTTVIFILLRLDLPAADPATVLSTRACPEMVNIKRIMPTLEAT